MNTFVSCNDSRVQSFGRTFQGLETHCCVATHRLRTNVVDNRFHIEINGLIANVTNISSVLSQLYVLNLILNET
jgi:hypothetical protein